MNVVLYLLKNIYNLNITLTLSNSYDKDNFKYYIFNNEVKNS